MWSNADTHVSPGHYSRRPMQMSYQLSSGIPMTVFGQHEEKTLLQFEHIRSQRCTRP